MKALFYTAVINGLLASPACQRFLLVTTDRRIMHNQPSSFFERNLSVPNDFANVRRCNRDVLVLKAEDTKGRHCTFRLSALLFIPRAKISASSLAYLTHSLPAAILWNHSATLCSAADVSEIGRRSGKIEVYKSLHRKFAELML